MQEFKVNAYLHPSNTVDSLAISLPARVKASFTQRGTSRQAVLSFNTLYTTYINIYDININTVFLTDMCFM